MVIVWCAASCTATLLPVVVRQIEVRHAEVEGAAQNGPLDVDGAVVPEVLPQPESNLGQVDATAPAAAVRHLPIMVLGGDVGHGQESATARSGGEKRITGAGPGAAPPGGQA